MKLLKSMGLALIIGSTLISSAVVNAETLLVTGANRGQGLGWVKHFVTKRNATVIATARKPEQAKELNDFAKKSGGKVIVAKLDVTNEDDIKALGEKLKRQNIKIDVVVNNAGVTDAEDYGKWTKKSFEFNFAVNTIGPALVTQMVDPYLNNNAKILNISSGNGCTACQKKVKALTAYGISKAGVNHLTKRMSHRLKDRNIVVVAMTPGMVKTDMNPIYGKLSVEEAINIMTTTLDKLTIKDTGTFISNKGKSLPW